MFHKSPLEWHLSRNLRIQPSKMHGFWSKFHHEEVKKTSWKGLWDSWTTFPHEQLQCNISWKGLPYRHHNDAKLVDEYPPPDHGGKGVGDSQKKWYFIILQNPCLQKFYTPVGGVGWEKTTQNQSWWALRILVASSTATSSICIWD